MTYEETGVVLKILSVTYPQSFKGWDQQQALEYKNIFWTCLKHRSLKQVKTAVVHFIRDTDREFAPNPGQINHWIDSLPGYKVDALAADFFPSEYKQISDKPLSQKEIAEFRQLTENNNRQHDDAEDHAG